jgi:cyclopropane-fatty-acyl-phospholipid synthase
MELLERSATATELPLVGRLLARQMGKLRVGSLDVEMYGRHLHFEGAEAGPAGHILIDRPRALLWRLLTNGDIGFAESYMAGEWHSNDLTPLLWVLTLNLEPVQPSPLGAGFNAWLTRLRHAWRANTPRGSRKNIADHYDLGNDFYRLWLDPGMTYSAAIFGHPEEPLETAQERKYARLLELAGARPGQRLLEIGCGWGGFAAHAARRGVVVSGVTLSRAQLDWGRRRATAEGRGNTVDLQYLDYRNIRGVFDCVVSIEMFEAVGEAYWTTYLRKLRDCLKRGGRAALQIITIDGKAFEGYRRQPEFIQRYIFPGGMLPSVGAFDAAVADAGLQVVAREFGGLDYAATLARWHRAFQRQTRRLGQLGFDGRFQRMWRYYLSYCEAGFRAGRIDVMRVALEHAD